MFVLAFGMEATKSAPDGEFIGLVDRNRLYERNLQNLKNDKRISKKNKDLVMAFIRDCSLGKTKTGRVGRKLLPPP